MYVFTQGHGALPVTEAKLEGCFEEFRAHGYSESTLRKRRTTFRALIHWLVENGASDDDALTDQWLMAFLARTPVTRREQRKLEAAAIGRLVAYLNIKGGHPASLLPGTLAADEIARAYTRYLYMDAGLAENSVRAYLPHVRVFLNDCIERDGDFNPERLDSVVVQKSLLDRVPQLSVACSRLLVAALRSFLRFLFRKGLTEIDLSVSIPAYKKHQYSVPAFLSPEEVEAILKTPDKATSGGLRDFAILLLLARLGLRAGEIVNLELANIRWREAKVVIKGKGRIFESLPLLADVGEAVVAYLRDGRPVSKSRRVFLRSNAPRVGLAGPAAVGHIVRRALARASIKPSGRGAAHLFRHSLATQMIRKGASMEEISQVLRHRSEATTEIYTQVAFESLRGVSRAWPTATGGGR